ncbi:RNA polymerase sigma factor [Radiobacillus kanasensis]|uniref:RNA polymerase sigma factor n=1 Tax=Radiobacillus kanasensis TaxID=2844358 RepID=UPI001E4BAC9D|nr:RNA polymerase sigma factor [Radiobacillus kanasensis]UFU00639.1 RNA polymerase sigma factor [Radiobacillus kanasensis]
MKQKNELILSWYDQYSVYLFKYVLKMVKDVQTAEDITQDTFIKAFNKMGMYEEIRHPKTWLFRIAHNLTVDYIRKQAPILLIKDFFFQEKDMGPSTESQVVIKESSKELYEAILKLKPSYREVIILRKIEGFSVQDTAQILKWSESKVKTTLLRALRTLEKQLSEEEYLNEI